MQHVQENLRSAEKSAPGSMTDEELRLVERVRDEYRSLCPIPCTDCRYCMPCPRGVDIPEIFRLFNDGRMYNDLKKAKFAYNGFLLPEEKRADRCVACGACESACPQQIPIIRSLQDIHQHLAETAA